MLRKFTFFILLVSSILANAQEPDFLWAVDSRGPLTQEGNAIVTDGDNNVYTVGRFTDSADFDPGPGVHMLTSLGDEDLFVQKLDAEGNLVWAYSTGRNYTGTCVVDVDRAVDIVVDKAGDLIIAGTFSGNTDFDFSDGEHILSSDYDQRDAFILKINSDAEFIWVKQFRGYGYENISSLNLDGEENIYISGNYKGDMDLDPGPGEEIIANVAGYSEVFIAKFDPEGNLEWGHTLGNGGHNMTGISDVDQDGNMTITGEYKGTMDFDLGPDEFNLSPIGDTRAIYILTLDTGGNFKWAKSFASNANSYALKKDLENNTVVTGQYFVGTDFDPGPDSYYLYPEGNFDIYVLKLDEDGDFIWAKSIGGVDQDYAWKMDIKNGNSIYISGEISGTVDMDPGPEVSELTVEYIKGMFLLKLNSEGEYCYAQSYNGYGLAKVQDIYVDQENIHMTGNYNGTVDFDASELVYELTSFHVADHFVLKYAEESQVSIEDQSKSYTFNIYPNPSNGTITIDYNNLIGVQTKLYDAMGQLVLFEKANTNTLQQFDLKQGPGIYFIELEVNREIHHYKIIIR